MIGLWLPGKCMPGSEGAVSHTKGNRSGMNPGNSISVLPFASAPYAATCLLLNFSLIRNLSSSIFIGSALD